MEEEFKKRLKRAEDFLDCLEAVKRNELSRKQSDFMHSNARLLQKEMEELGYGFYKEIVSISPPRSLTKPLIANFPTLYENVSSRIDTVMNKLPKARNNLLAYIQEIKESQEDSNRLKTTVEKEFDKLIFEIKYNLRKNVIREPQSEKDIQEALQGLLAIKDFIFKREKDSTGFSGKSFRPDFTIENLEVAIEVKFVDESSKLSRIVEEMSADLKPYSKTWKSIIFVVYDKAGAIGDENAFKRDFEENKENLVRVFVIKH